MEAETGGKARRVKLEAETGGKARWRGLGAETGGKARWGAMQTSQHQPRALSGTHPCPAKRTNQPHTHTKPHQPRFPSEVRAAAHIYILTPGHKKDSIITDAVDFDQDL